MISQRVPIISGLLLLAGGVLGLVAMPPAAGAPVGEYQLAALTVIVGPLGLMLFVAGLVGDQVRSPTRVLIAVASWACGVALFTFLAVGLGRVNP